MKKYFHTLDENFDAAEKFEQGMISLGKSINANDPKPSGGLENKNVPQKKIMLAPKNKEVHDDVGYRKAFQNISYEFIDLKKTFSGNPFTRKAFRPYKNDNKEQPQQLTLSSPPIQRMNFEEGRVEHYCHA